jgi:hypothetical protein
MIADTNDIFDFPHVQEQIKQENLDYFQARVSLYSQKDLSNLFFHGCWHNCSPQFIDGIIAMGMGMNRDSAIKINLNYGCVKGLLFNQHYDLLEHILSHYGKSHHIDFFEMPHTDTPIHLASLVKRRETHQILKLVLQPLPQHTKSIKKVDKPYLLSIYLSQQYNYIYNTILSVALAHRAKASEDKATGYQLPRLVTDKTRCIDEGIAIIAGKKFPIMEHIAEKIRFFKLEHLFERRLSHLSQEESTGMAHNVLLQKERLDIYDSMDKKLVMLKELCTEIHTPIQMIETIERKMMENGEIQISQTQRVLDSNARDGLDSEGFEFMQSIGHRPHLFHFFNKYFNYERAALHHKLDEALVKMMNQDGDNGDIYSYHPSDIVKL